MGRFLCALGLHSWRDAALPYAACRVRVCRRGCTARRETWIWGGLG